MPVISKAVLSDGVITITGTGFGSGPRVVIYDNFERGVAGSYIPIGQAVVGSWVKAGGATPKFGKDPDGNGFMVVTYATTWTEYLEASLGPNATNVFISYFWRVPAGKLFPGENSPDTLNWKLLWLMNSGTTDGDMMLPVTMNNQPTQAWAVGGNDNPYSKWIENPEGPLKGPWHHFQFALKASSTAGSIEMWETRSNGVIKLIDERKPTVNGTDTWNLIHVPGYGRSYPGQEVHLDDFYLADGPNAKARVVVGNNAVYNASSKLRILPPISWTDTEIRIKNKALEFVTIFSADGAASNTIKVEAGTVSPATKYPFSVQVTDKIKLTGEVEIQA